MGRRWLGVVTAVTVPAMLVALLPVEGAAAARAEKAGRSGPALAVSSWSRAEVIAGQAIDTGGQDQAFVVGSSDGRWGRAEVVPGTVALGTNATLTYLSCPAAGQCSAIGVYGAGLRVFVDSERDYVWGTAEEMPGTARYNRTGFVGAYALSCGSPGNCTAGGYYESSLPSVAVAYLEDQVNGVWQSVEPVPGVPVRKIWEGGMVVSLSCPAAGDCAAGGLFTNYAKNQQALVAEESRGSWGDGRAVPGTIALNQGGAAITNAVSCATPGECAAGGIYSGPGYRIRVFITSEDNGTWAQAEQVPGTAGSRQPYIDAIACPAAGACVAVGDEEPGNGADVFVTSQT
jgi:hypothetical protein